MRRRKRQATLLRGLTGVIWSVLEGEGNFGGEEERGESKDQIWDGEGVIIRTRKKKKRGKGKIHINKSPRGIPAKTTKKPSPRKSTVLNPAGSQYN